MNTKKLLTLLLLLLTRVITANGQCTTNYSFAGTTDTLVFTNLSSLSNAHFYWNFGDGSGSNAFSPTHVFPDDGKYLVTLYGLDTVTHCVNVKEKWINVVKPDSFLCDVFFTDTIINSTIYTNNFSSNCSGNYVNCNVVGPANNYCNSVNINGWFSSLFMHGMQSYANDSVYGSRLLNAYYKTMPWNYSSAKNYQNCSANFEFTIDYKPTFATVTFTAMNKNATQYKFYVTGFGDPIILSGKSASFDFNYISYLKFYPANVYLITADSINNCSDSVNQQLLIKNPNYTFPVNCAIYAPI